MRMLKPKKALKFGGKLYHHYKYEPMKTEAKRIAKALRRTGRVNVRVVAQPGYGGGWNLYTRNK